MFLATEVDIDRSSLAKPLYLFKFEIHRRKFPKRSGSNWFPGPFWGSAWAGHRLDSRGELKNHSFTLRNRRALLITETELRLIAAPAMMGLSSNPKKG